MTCVLAVAVVSFLAGLTIGQLHLRAARQELDQARRDALIDRARAHQWAADAEMWRKRAVNTAARLDALRAAPVKESDVVWLHSRWMVDP